MYIKFKNGSEIILEEEQLEMNIDLESDLTEEELTFKEKIRLFRASGEVDFQKFCNKLRKKNEEK